RSPRAQRANGEPSIGRNDAKRFVHLPLHLRLWRQAFQSNGFMEPKRIGQRFQLARVDDFASRRNGDDGGKNPTVELIDGLTLMRPRLGSEVAFLVAAMIEHW